MGSRHLLSALSLLSHHLLELEIITLSEINNILYTKLLVVEVAGFRFNDPEEKSDFGTTFVRREL